MEIHFESFKEKVKINEASKQVVGPVSMSIGVLIRVMIDMRMEVQSRLRTWFGIWKLNSIRMMRLITIKYVRPHHIEQLINDCMISSMFPG